MAALSGGEIGLCKAKLDHLSASRFLACLSFAFDRVGGTTKSGILGSIRDRDVKDLWVSFAVGGLLGLIALVAMLAFDESVPALLAIAFGVLGAMAVAVFRLGPGIRHLATGMERDRVEIAKATEELRKLLSRVREPNEIEIEMYGGSQRLVRPIEAREKKSRIRKRP